MTEADQGFCPLCGAPPFSPCTGIRGFVLGNF